MTSKLLNPLCRFLVLSGCLIGLSACEPSGYTGDTASQSGIMLRKKTAGLSQDYAEFRQRQISDISYDISLSLNPSATDFAGLAKISFDLSPDNQSPLTLDFETGNISSVTVNGVPAEYEFEQWFISLPASQLATGSNTIEISYTRPFSNDGAGLHRFTDPENGEVYVYTQFEPYDANRVFPLFDQPDLKAPYTLQVIAPAGWQVISNNRESRIEIHGEERRWFFPATLPMSSYLYALHAGPFTAWESQAGDIPLRLFARNTLAPYINASDWFTFTRQNFDFFQNYFSTPYPFGKYDQVIVPDFNFGAMENTGAVTFSERYISRGEYSHAQRRSIASVIAHEMAHMWFGNLVTMKWWNDLWLNESFATYMANLSLAENSEFEGIWEAFYFNTKQWAYETDRQVTTHPIDQEVLNSLDAFSIIDGITYGKGASILKQLPFLIEEDNFRNGVRNYLNRHAYSNTTLADFVTALSESSEQDLEQWQFEWLNNSGVNTIESRFTCENNQITSLELMQYPPVTSTASDILRTQRTRVALYHINDDNTLQASNVIPVTYSGELTAVTDAIGLPCPALVIPNQDDMAFVKMRLDDVSRATLFTHINHIPDLMTRMMLWQSLWDDVQDAGLSLDDFISFVFQALPDEDHYDVIDTMADYLVEAWQYYSLGNNELHGSQKREIEAFFLDQLNTSEPGNDLQKVWFDHLLSVTHSPSVLNMVSGWLSGTDIPDGLALDQDRRWNMVLTLNRNTHGNYEEVLEAEYLSDPSDIGRNMYLAAQAIRPNGDIKSFWINTLTTEPEAYKLATMRAVMARLFPAGQPTFRELYLSTLLSAIPGLSAQGNTAYLMDYMDTLPFHYCSQASLDLLNDAIAEFLTGTTSIFVQQGLLLNRQENQRCMTIQDLLSTDTGTGLPR